MDEGALAKEARFSAPKAAGMYLEPRGPKNAPIMVRSVRRNGQNMKPTSTRAISSQS